MLPAIWAALTFSGLGLLRRPLARLSDQSRSASVVSMMPIRWVDRWLFGTGWVVVNA